MIRTSLDEKKRAKWRASVRAMSTGAREFSPHELLKLKPRHIEVYNVPGIYIIYNKTKNMYYVGQSKTILTRVRKHFTGKGNGDVYADYKYGDEFFVRFLRLDQSECSSLDELELINIEAFEAKTCGYNRSIGISNRNV